MAVNNQSERVGGGAFSSDPPAYYKAPNSLWRRGLCLNPAVAIPGLGEHLALILQGRCVYRMYARGNDAPAYACAR